MQRCWGYFKFRRLRGRTSTYFLYGKMRKRICGFLDFRPEITHFDAAYLVYIPIIINIFRKRKKKTSVVVQKTNLFEPRKTEWVFIVCRRCLIIILSHLSAASPLIKNNNGTSTTLTLITYPLLPNFCYPSPLSNYRQCSKICKRAKFWEVVAPLNLI